jgi:hypothetical protein
MSESTVEPTNTDPAGAAQPDVAGSQAGVSTQEYQDDHNLAGQDEATKDPAGVTGGEYADPDANPAFHGSQPGVGEQEVIEHTAYEGGPTET